MNNCYFIFVTDRQVNALLVANILDVVEPAIASEQAHRSCLRVKPNQDQHVDINIEAYPG